VPTDDPLQIESLTAERDRLRANLTRCCWCLAPTPDLAALKAHSGGCPKHPAVVERDALRARLAAAREAAGPFLAASAADAYPHDDLIFYRGGDVAVRWGDLRRLAAALGGGEGG
jgi:hypothetical protein